MTTPFDQDGYAIRFEWGLAGALAVAPHVDLAVVVDTLSFTTSVVAALSKTMAVMPFRWGDDAAASVASAAGATLAVGRSMARPGEVSLSPVSIARSDGIDRLVLPSPNGSTICAALAEAGTTVLAGCLRNATSVAAVAGAAVREGRARSVLLVAAGERWPDGSLRPCVEDLWGAGAVVAALDDAVPTEGMSPEALSAAHAFAGASGDLGRGLWSCSSGRELIDRGYAEDVEFAANLDASTVVPVLIDGWFTTPSGDRPALW